VRQQHYLKGSIYCGQCGSRLIVTHSKGKTGRIYPSFICVGRQQKRTSCSQSALSIEKVEAAIVARYATVQLPADEIIQLRAHLGEELSKLSATAEHERSAQERTLRKLAGERRSCLTPTTPMPYRLICSRASNAASRQKSHRLKADWRR
jgi:hypothetical protein